MYTLIDCHCHLDFDDFDHDRSEALARAYAASVSDIIIPGVNANTWQKIADLCADNSNLYACFGIHPYTVNQHTLDDLTQLKHWLKAHNNVAVGECGLDFRQGQADTAVQLEFFQAQLNIAQNMCKPVVIHAVRATEQVIQSIQKYPGLRGMVHSYSGSYEQALKLIDLDFYISIGGGATYERATRIRDVVTKIPLDRLLFETDAPDQADSQHSGKRNEPAYLVNVLDTVTALRKESKETIAEQTTANAKQLFNL